MEEGNNGRIPNKKRGRPVKQTPRKTMLAEVGGRNAVDLIRCARFGLEPSLYDEIIPQVRAGNLSLAIVAYTGRFPHAQQREMLELFKRLGARRAKRYVECLTRPPDSHEIARRALAWASREFPVIEADRMAEALRIAANILEVQNEA